MFGTEPMAITVKVAVTPPQFSDEICAPLLAAVITPLVPSDKMQLLIRLAVRLTSAVWPER